MRIDGGDGDRSSLLAITYRSLAGCYIRERIAVCEEHLFTSAFHKISICAAWAALAFIAFATLSPIQYRPTLAGPQLEHFGAFAAMGCAFVFAYPRRTPIIIAIVVGSAFGLEALQLLTPDRHSRTIDALVKAAAGLGGIGIGRLALWALQKHSPYPTSVVQGEQSARLRTH